jgi:hypothetical protein
MKNGQLLLAGLMALAPPAMATGGFLQFEALTPTTVSVGGVVEFRVTFGKEQDYFLAYYGDPEPAPWPGVQNWVVGGHDHLEETFYGVSMQVVTGVGPPLEFSDMPGVPLGSGIPYGTSWTFSVTFDTPGLAQVSPQASWQSSVAERGDRTEGERLCFEVPDSDLYCSDWTFSSSSYDRLHDSSGGTGWGVLDVHVLASVPEAGTGMLWLGGLGLLHLFIRSRQPPGPRRSSVAMLRS